MTDSIKSFEYTLTTLTPLHVGSGSAMSSSEYCISNEVIIPNIQRLFSDYPEIIERFNEKFRSVSVREMGLVSASELLFTGVSNISDYVSYSISPFRNETFNFDSVKLLTYHMRAGVGQIETIVKDLNNKPYIPGSSIKGALRTAWAYDQCFSGRRAYDAISGLAWQGKDAEADSRLGAHVFHTPRKKHAAPGKGDVLGDLDVFRIIQIGDSVTRSNSDALILVTEGVLSADAPVRASGEIEISAYPASFNETLRFKEAIDEDVAFTGRFNFLGGGPQDDHATQAHNHPTPETLIAGVNRFALDLCRWEIEYFERIYDSPDDCNIGDVLSFYDDLLLKLEQPQSNTMYLSMGYGSGWHKTTIGLLLERRMTLESFTELRRRLSLARDRLDFEYPKSRKLVMNGHNSAYSPFGWVQLSF